MHSIFKRLLALVLILAMALCVVGCEEPEETPGASTPSSTQGSGNSGPTSPTNPGNSLPQITPDMGQTAYIIGGHEVSASILNFFYIDAIISYCNQYSYYLSYLIDINSPLNAASNTDKDGKSWADKFLEMAIENMTITYQLYDQALTTGHKLTEDELNSIDTVMDNLQMYATYYGFKNADEYLSNTYGLGATASDYRTYCELSTIANSYYYAYENAQVYDEEALRAYEADKYVQYNSYSYAYYYINASVFLSNTTNPSAEEKAAAVAAAKQAAEQIAAGQYASATDFDAGITRIMQANLGNDQQYSAVKDSDKLYSKINTLFTSWLSADGRQDGDMTCIANESGSGENKTVSGYYVVRFERKNENRTVLKNVRHLLVTFESSTESDKAAAKNAALALLAEFEKTDKSETAFAALAKEHTDDSGSQANGGLYEDIYPGQMVEPFEQWCFEEGRQHGDYGLVETTYGWHIMFFVSDSQMTFRDLMIREDLNNETMQKWLEELIEIAETTMVTTKYVNMELTISDL